MIANQLWTKKQGHLSCCSLLSIIFFYQINMDHQTSQIVFFHVQKTNSGWWVIIISPHATFNMYHIVSYTTTSAGNGRSMANILYCFWWPLGPYLLDIYNTQCNLSVETMSFLLLQSFHQKFIIICPRYQICRRND